MKRRTLIKTLIILTLFALDWAALHDIMNANESDLFLEYVTLAASAVIFILLAIHSHLGNKLLNSMRIHKNW